MISQWIEQNWPQLVSEGRWLRGDGPNWIQADQWMERPYRVLISRLSPWNDVLYSSTHRLLYGILASQPGIFPDLAYLPPLHDTPLFTKENIPWWIGASAHKGARDYHCIAISNALVQEYLNLAPALDHSGIPLSKKERLQSPEIPLVIMGGANSLHSTLLWNEDPLVDGIFIGEEPEVIATLFNRLAVLNKEGHDKSAQLQILAQEIPGFFEPEKMRDSANPVMKVHKSTPQVNAYKALEPFLPAIETAGVASLHIAEGCPSFCSFCAESYARKPYRETPLQEALTHARNLKRELGLDEIELFSFNFNNYSSIHEIVPLLAEEFPRIGLKSQRFDAIAEDPRMIQLMRQAGKSSVTCGLEGISDRLRSYMQKGLATEQLKRALELLLSEPLRELKIFLIATGHERAEDLAEFREFLLWFDHLYGRTPRRPRVTFSATPLVRFPWTPLEFEDAPSAEQGDKAVRAIKDCVVRRGFDFREAASGFEAEVSQILVRAQDPRILQALQKAQNQTGFLYSDGISPEFAQQFRITLQEVGLSWEFLLKGNSLEDTPLWRQASPGISVKFLREMFTASLDALQVPICLGTPQKEAKCLHCNACTPQERKQLVSRKETSPSLVYPVPTIVEIPLTVELSSRCLQWPWRTWQALLQRAILRTRPEWSIWLRGFSKGYWEKRLDTDFCMVGGIQEFRLLCLTKHVVDFCAFLRDDSHISTINRELFPWLRLHSTKPQGVERLRISGKKLDPAPWLLSKGLKHTLLKKDSKYYYDFSKDALRKKILREMVLEKKEVQEILDIRIEDKLELMDLLRNLSIKGTNEHWRKNAVMAIVN